MVNSNYAMASTLAGLKRLEAQVQRAMLEVSGKAPQMPEQQPEKVAEEMDLALKKSQIRANTVMSAIDISA